MNTILQKHGITPIDKRVTRIPMFVDSDVDMAALKAAVEKVGLALARDPREPWKLIVSNAP